MHFCGPIEDHGVKISVKGAREMHLKQRTWNVFCNFNINVIYLNYLCLNDVFWFICVMLSKKLKKLYKVVHNMSEE